MWQWWAIVAGIFFILEIITVGFLVFWIAIGALIAMIVSLFISDIIVQCAIFVISSALLIFLTKPFVNKFVNNETVLTNAYSIIGKRAIVLKKIDTNKTGQIKVASETWSAICEQDIEILEGTEVEIVKIDGVKVIVKPIEITMEV